MTPVNIRSRLELLLDNHLIESVDNRSFQMHSPPRAVNHPRVLHERGLRKMALVTLREVLGMNRGDEAEPLEKRAARIEAIER